MFNRISLHGRFTATPELKVTQSGTAVTSFYLAVDDGKKANFFKCVAWAGTAKIFTKADRLSLTANWIPTPTPTRTVSSVQMFSL